MTLHRPDGSEWDCPAEKVDSWAPATRTSGHEGCTAVTMDTGHVQYVTETPAQIREMMNAND